MFILYFSRDMITRSRAPRKTYEERVALRATENKNKERGERRLLCVFHVFVLSCSCPEAEAEAQPQPCLPASLPLLASSDCPPGGVPRER